MTLRRVAAFQANLRGSSVSGILPSRSGRACPVLCSTYTSRKYERYLANTRALVTHILAAKGLDGGDHVLAKSVAERLIRGCGCRRSGGTWPLRESKRARSFGHCSDHS